MIVGSTWNAKTKPSEPSAPAGGPPSWRALLASEAVPLPLLDDTAPAMLIYTSGTDMKTSLPPWPSKP